ncbi:hypothetical protein M0811_04946 [Anaeramoeba ignava]|uniref:Uncharacterized protein n=1 Tax=Anaeramoeba ignava TaxID=1746090 RepID=A0A9Q0LRR6_ANAIG|nr:hypothetical protein M0811_04946 [Anaeramoeba ignava]
MENIIFNHDKFINVDEISFQIFKIYCESRFKMLTFIIPELYQISFNQEIKFEMFFNKKILSLNDLKMDEIHLMIQSEKIYILIPKNIKEKNIKIDPKIELNFYHLKKFLRTIFPFSFLIEIIEEKENRERFNELFLLFSNLKGKGNENFENFQNLLFSKLN